MEMLPASNKQKYLQFNISHSPLLTNCCINFQIPGGRECQGTTQKLLPSPTHAATIYNYKLQQILATRAAPEAPAGIAIMNERSLFLALILTEFFNL